MGAKKKNATPIHEISQPPWMPNGSVTARNLRSKELTGVIFGCTHHTIQECLDNLLFGLPASHYAYVRNINPGMALFLFNYSDRKLHGIFEAITSGQMRINPYAWSSDGSEPTQYPAQVRVKYRSRCQPLTEEQFKPVIGKNYYIEKHFWFELDHKQTKALIALYSSTPVIRSSLWKPKLNNNPPVKTLPFPGSSNNGHSRASSNFHVLANDNPSSGDESSEGARKYHPEEIQSCDGPSSTSVISNKSPHAEETKLDDSMQYQARISLSSQNSSTSVSDPSWNELGWVEDDPLPVDTSNLEDSKHCVVTEDMRCLKKEHKSGAKVTDPSSDGCVEWEQLHTSMSTGENCEAYCAGSQSGKKIAVMKPVFEFPGPSVPEVDSSNIPEAPTTCFPTVISEHFHESTILGKIHTQMQAIREGRDSILARLSGQPQHTLVSTSEKINAENSISFVGVNSGMQLSDQIFMLLKLAQELENLKATQILQTWKVDSLEHDLAESKEEVRLLRQKYEIREAGSSPVKECSAKSNYPSTCDVLASSDDVAAYKESVFLVGGCDGESWLSSLNLYTPSSDIITSLKPMDTARSYASTTKMNGNLYVLGGVDGETTNCHDTVSLYTPSRDQWTTCPPLKRAKGNLAATSVNGKIFAIGGGSGIDCFSEVEFFDGNASMWFQSRPMRSKRFAPAAVEIDGVIYVVGGYNGQNYLRSAERFDYREHSWTPLESMSTARGCHSLAVLNGKIYALGGYDGKKMVSTVEVFDPRNGKWTFDKEMHVPRGYAGAAVLGESLYVIGGMKDHVEVLDTVECYKEGKGWQRMMLKGIGKRCFFSAIAM